MQLFLSLGSNLGAREAMIRRAVNAISDEIGEVVCCSSLHETAPEGFSSPYAFLNAVVQVETALTPEEILQRTQRIEQQLGRTRKTQPGEGYADRCIDIDLLALGDMQLALSPALTLPHPRLSGRGFVLAPWAEIAPEYLVPGIGKTVAQLLSALPAPASTPRVELLTTAGDNDLRALKHLLAELSDTAKPLTREALDALLHTPQTRVYVVRNCEGTPVASATLCLCASPTGTKAWVEDVVVTKAYRHRGYARALLQALHKGALEHGAKALCLTSRPEREAANRLYQAMGFARRQTNVYRLALDMN